MIKDGTNTGNGINSANHISLGAGQIICNNCFVTDFDPFHFSVAANISSTAGS